MTCDTCGNKEAARLSYDIAGGCRCDKCGAPGHFKFSDVFFKGEYFDANISDPVKSPHGSLIRSREHKAQLMREYGLREHGDKRHGTRQRF